jgi:hypothetical protein
VRACLEQTTGAELGLARLATGLSATETRKLIAGLKVNGLVDLLAEDSSARQGGVLHAPSLDTDIFGHRKTEHQRLALVHGLLHRQPRGQLPEVGSQSITPLPDVQADARLEESVIQ